MIDADSGLHQRDQFHAEHHGLSTQSAADDAVSVRKTLMDPRGYSPISCPECASTEMDALAPALSGWYECTHCGRLWSPEDLNVESPASSERSDDEPAGS